MKLLTLCISLFSVLSISCKLHKSSIEISAERIWTDVQISTLKEKPERLPIKFRLLKLNSSLFKAKVKTDTISLPLPEGGFSSFLISESTVMSPGLAAKFPNIKTYKGIGINEKTTLRFERNKNKFYFSMLWNDQTILINPISAADTVNYISYYKTDADTSIRKAFELPQFIEPR